MMFAHDAELRESPAPAQRCSLAQRKSSENYSEKRAAPTDDKVLVRVLHIEETLECMYGPLKNAKKAVRTIVNYRSCSR